MKRKIVLIILEILLIGCGVTLFLNRNTLILKSKGFNDTEISLIEQLSKEDREFFLENEGYKQLFGTDSFYTSSFSDYLDCLRKYTDDPKEAVYLVNRVNGTTTKLNEENIPYLLIKEADVTKIERYKEYQNNNPELSMEKVLEMVNQDIDQYTLEYSDSLLEIIDHQWFKKENINRYLHYIDSKGVDVEKGIRDVNANLDHPYYTEIQKSNVDDGYLVICNKYYSLESDYVPANIVSVEEPYGYTNQSMESTAYNAFKKMADAAKEDCLTLYITSGYRSYDKQKNIYNRYVSNDGQANADTYSARPGHSEHQTGLAADIVTGPGGSLSGFRGTAQAAWLEEHGAEYGFILRYTKAEQERTGYIDEPWHYRYVGVEVAKEIKKLGITFDEYYELYVK